MRSHSLPGAVIHHYGLGPGALGPGKAQDMNRTRSMIDMTSGVPISMNGSGGGETDPSGPVVGPGSPDVATAAVSVFQSACL